MGDPFKDLSGSLEGAGGIGGLLARSHGYTSGNWPNHNYYHADGNGNVTYLVSSAQTLAARYRYDPYGNLISSSETLGYLGTPNTYRFSSKMVDVRSGHYYYGYRFYEPNFQRWVNRDPIQEEGGLNLYGFVRQDPLSQVDFLGLRNTPWPFNGTVSVDKGCPRQIFWIDDDNKSVDMIGSGGRTPPWVDADFVECAGTWYKIGAGTFSVGCGCSCPSGFPQATPQQLETIRRILIDYGVIPP